MLKEVADDGWLGLELAEALPGECGERGDRWRECIGHAPLDPRIRLLLRVELRRVRRQVSERVVAPMRGDELRYPTRAMGVQAVPDDQERPAELAAEVGQRTEHGARIGRSRLVPGVEPPLRCDDDDAGDLTASAQAPYHGRPTAPGPCSVHPDAEGVARLIPERDRAPLAPRLFFQRRPGVQEPLGHEPLVSLLRPAGRSVAR